MSEFSGMDPVLRARWIDLISSAATRRDASVLLGVPHRILKEFRLACMPDHVWPNTKTPEDVARDKFEQRERKRAAREADPSEVELQAFVSSANEALAKINPAFSMSATVERIGAKRDADAG